MDKVLGSWPLATLICIVFFLLLFRIPIRDLIDRFRRLGFGDKSIEFSSNTQKTALERQKQNPGPLTQITDTMVPASHAMPPPVALYNSIEEEVRKTLSELSLPADIEKAWLIRSIATARVERVHEVVYRLILASQISLVLQANTAIPVDPLKAMKIYDAAKADFPQIYSDFSFDSWVNYPVSMGLLKKEEKNTDSYVLRVTEAGKDFLHYLVNNGLTSGKVG
jgi:hypothetical protein